MFHSTSQRNLFFRNRYFTFPLSLHLFCNLKPSKTIESPGIFDPLKPYNFHPLEKIPDTPLKTGREDSFPLALRIFIQTVIQLNFLIRIHFYGKFLIIQTMTKPWEKLRFWLDNTVLIVKYSWQKSQQLLFWRNKTGTLHKPLHKLHLELKVPLLQNFIRKTILISIRIKMIK